ncbi:MAG: DUF805 domain-containing protein [Pseudomonadota bacterium]
MSKPVFSDLFTLSGRRNRLSYFLFTLIVWAIYIADMVFIAAFDGVDLFDYQASTGSPGFATFVGIILLLAVAISACIVGAQRCRDFGWSGWAILLGLVPFVGLIFNIALFFIPGTPGDNRYGLNPLAQDFVT